MNSTQTQNKNGITIEVSTTGYFHKDENMKAKVDSLPKKLNKNCIKWMKTWYMKKKLFELPEDDDENENYKKDYLKPLLSFYRQKNWDERPDFVTSRNVLTATASSKEATIVILAYKKDGVMYMERPDDKGYGAKMKSSAENEKRLTEEENGNSMKNSDTYAVMTAKVVNEKNEKFTIYYSAQIDATTKHTDGKLEHHELKLLSGGVRKGYNWKFYSCQWHWQAFFGECFSLIASARTYESLPHHVYSVKQFKRTDILKKAEEMADEFKWTIAEGELKIYKLLEFVKDSVGNGERCVFSRTANEWTKSSGDENEELENFYQAVDECGPAE